MQQNCSIWVDNQIDTIKIFKINVSLSSNLIFLLIINEYISQGSGVVMSTNYVQIRISKFSYELDEPCDSFNLTTNCVESFALKRPN